MEWYLKVVRDNYANFKGRARRKEYWMFILFNFIASCIAAIIDKILGTALTAGSMYGWVYLLYCLAVFIPSLAVFVRRLHDVGKSGFWIFIALIPIVGAIWLLVLLCTAGDSGSNKYGPSPKA